ncbi:hypothetical protein [Hydrogenimonas sp.]|uniref:hypothetical protein n=1 Tax=Hydrogenimonas sp. TaxID=2231112 RepID=UPI00261514E6|nr:hypothetical protein [Hydrogenimonas sp.]
MIFGLTPVKATQALLGKLAAIEMNALLQIGIKVLEKQDSQHFLIQMGRHTFTTKSETPLEPGRDYWVEMAQTREGIVHLKRLHPKPHMLQKHFPEHFGSDFLERLTEKPDPSTHLKEQLLQNMASAGSKEQFQNLTQLLLSLHQGIVTLPIEERGKKMLLQMRKKKKREGLNQNSVEFYAAMNNLGPIEGTIHRTEHRQLLKLELFYPKSLVLLEREKEHLNGFDQIEIRLKTESIEPFWDGAQPGLLDIKG